MVLRQFFFRLLSLASPRLRELRRIDTALAAIGRMRDELAAAAADPAASKGLAAQLQMIVAVIEQDQILKKTFADRAGDPPAALLRQLSKRGTAAPEAIAVPLDDLVARLAVRRVILAGDGLIPIAPTVEPAAAPIAETPTRALWRRPRGAAVTTPAAVLLAVFFVAGGLLLLGTQAARLSANLDQAAQRARGDLDELARSTRSEIEAQRRALDLAQRAADNLRAGLVEQMARESRELELRISSFARDSDQLRHAAAERAAASLRRDLESFEATLRDEIAAPLARLRDRDLRALEERVAALQAGLQQSETGLATSNAELKAMAPGLQRLRDLTTEADSLAGALAAVRSDQLAAHKAAMEASDYAQMARQRLDAAQLVAASFEELRNRAADTLQSATGQLAAYQRTLAGLETRLDTVEQSMPRATASTGSDARLVRSRPGDGADADDRVGSIGAPLRALDPPAADGRPPVDSPQTLLAAAEGEGQFGRAGWKLIQQALRARGFTVGRIDGLPHIRTRKAIRDFQTQIGATPTGQLTPDQIRLLFAAQAAR
jgi:hypothetical protein